jgi:hypothetical protein
MVGGLSAIAVGLIHPEAPKDGATKYESANIVDKFLLIANSTPEERSRARPAPQAKFG